MNIIRDGRIINSYNVRGALNDLQTDQTVKIDCNVENDPSASRASQQMKKLRNIIGWEEFRFFSLGRATGSLKLENSLEDQEKVSFSKTRSFLALLPVIFRKCPRTPKLEF